MVPWLLPIQKSLISILPLIMVGAVAILVRDFPLLAFQHMMNAAFGKAWKPLCENLFSGSLGIASLAVVFALSASITKVYNDKSAGIQINPVVSCVIVLSSFCCLIAPSDAETWRLALSLDTGLLLSLLIAIPACFIFIGLAQVDFLRLPCKAVGTTPEIRAALQLLPAGMLTVFLFGLIHAVLAAAGVGNLQLMVRDILTRPFVHMEAQPLLAFFYAGLIQFLWFFGIHGPDFMFPVEQNILTPAALANASGLMGGHAFIFTKQFFDIFTKIGGSGSTLCLIIAVFLRSRDSGARKLCLLALLPALCNVNEPVLFGLPLVLNPVYFLPFLFTPVIQAVVAYAATVTGLVPCTTVAGIWTMPVFISGYLDTGGMSGAVLQLVNLGVGIAAYAPFVSLAERLHQTQGKQALKMLLHSAEGGEAGPDGLKCLSRPGFEGRLARTLANDLEQNLALGKELYMEYQPQVDCVRHRVHGVEALLRWRHPVYGRIAPPITVALAEDLDKIDVLGLFVLRTACRQRRAWDGLVPEDVVMAVNVTPKQLRKPHFVKEVLQTLAESGIRPGQLEIEITESTACEADERNVGVLRSLRREGIHVAIDDFGMGHTSLRYLQELPVDTVKIDRSLTEYRRGGVNEQIVKSIVDLSGPLGITPLVEGVERAEQLSRFVHLGCTVFQGYLFSRPISGTDCQAFIEEWERTAASAAPAPADAR